MAWDKTKIAEGVKAPDLNDEIRANWEALEDALNKEMNFSTGGTASLQGIFRQGSARPFFQDTAPATRVDGSAFASTDLGMLWIDTNSSPDNQFNMLTATTPTWTPVSTEIIATLLASARTFLAALSVQMADATLTLQNTDEEDADGGRQSRFIGKGEQSGGEATTLGHLEFSHDGTGDDQKGNLKIMLNDGDDDDAPSITILDINSTETIAKTADMTTFHTYAGMYSSAATVLTSGSDTKVAFDTDIIDSGALTDLTNNRITPGVVGNYRVSGVLGISNLDAGKEFLIKIKKNGTTIANARTYAHANGNAPIPSVSTVVYLDGNDYVELFGTHNHGSNRNTLAGLHNCQLTLNRIG